MSLAADMGHHSGRATPSLHDAPYRQFEEATGRRSTYPLPIAVQTNPATSADACRVSSIGKTRLYALAKEGRLEMRKIGGRTLVPAASLRTLIDGEA